MGVFGIMEIMDVGVGGRGVAMTGVLVGVFARLGLGVFVGGWSLEVGLLEVVDLPKT